MLTVKWDGWTAGESESGDGDENRANPGPLIPSPRPRTSRLHQSLITELSQAISNVLISYQQTNVAIS